MDLIDSNYKKIFNEIEKFNPNAQICVVTKNQPLPKILSAIKAGAKIIGENRVQEAEKKFPYIPNEIKKHLIGHLQSNKVTKAVQLFDVIESVDSLSLAQKINQAAKNKGKIMPIMIEINITDEPQKFGIKPTELTKMIKNCAQLKHIKIIGIMTIGKYQATAKECRSHFKRMQELCKNIIQIKQENLDVDFLSMGMSNDYQIALQEGSNLIRIGTAIFGERN